MSVKKFKFVSPGVFINEIDNSFIPKSAETIGPVVIGRAQRGLANQPVRVESYSDFVEMFGDTVPGNAGGDVYRAGNGGQSPMYGTYAAKAFLKSNVAPLTYVRLLGTQSPNADSDGQAGWTTDNKLGDANSGGAVGLWVMPSQSSDLYDAADGHRYCWTGSNAAQLAAVFYLDAGKITLSGSGVIPNTGSGTDGTVINKAGALVSSDSNGLFKIAVSGTNTGLEEVIEFGFDDNKDNFIRKRFNTNPQLRKAGNFYPGSAERDYWLGESFEQEVRDMALVGQPMIGIIAGIALSGSTGTGPHNMKGQGTTEAKTGWVVGQDLGENTSFKYENAKKLFRLVGRGHGEWLNRNVKVSIANIRQSQNSTSGYGTFSVIVRILRDTDNNVQRVERFDNCTLDPTAPNFIAKKIGDQYYQWDETERRLKLYGEFANKSKFVYVEMDQEVEAGASDDTLLPFGYYGPPMFKNALVTGSLEAGPELAQRFVVLDGDLPGWELDTATEMHISGAITGSSARNTKVDLRFPEVRLRTSASAGGLADPTRAFWGLDVTRTTGSTRSDASVGDVNRLLYGGYSWGSSADGVDAYRYIFTLDDVVSGSAGWFYRSGSRVDSTSYTAQSGKTYKDLLDNDYNRFTMPMGGANDGFNIRVPDPLYNKQMNDASSDTNSYAYYTWKRGIDTVADPEFVDMNLLATPGLTINGLTTHAINTCEDRADALALIDLQNVYIPTHEEYKGNKQDRIGTTPLNAANDLKDRRLDSSYGATFYPWVQTRDENNGQLLWIPPSVAMMGVLASSERKSDVWFAPAGFNRGGLTDGAAGIPVVNVTERLTSKNRDTLYEARINPIASFPSSGIVVFGQKTLQERQSALDRINVRRLVIFLKKQISIISNQILFEQNVQATGNRFIGLVEPFLSNVKTQFGITDYRLILDESTTTPDLIDQNIMYAKIMIKPARAIEYIAIDFVILSTGASFDD